MIGSEKKWLISFKPLVIGFILSIVLTLAAYFVVINQNLDTLSLGFVLLTLGLSQALFQLIFFLHLGIDSKPRLDLMMFLFMLLVMCVVVFGSLWVMYNLNYNLMENVGN